MYALCSLTACNEAGIVLHYVAKFFGTFTFASKHFQNVKDSQDINVSTQRGANKMLMSQQFCNIVLFTFTMQKCLTIVNKIL